MKSVLVTNTGDTVHPAHLAARDDLNIVFVTEARFLDQYPEATDIAIVESLNDPSTAAHAVVRARGAADFSHVVSLSERAAQTAGYLRSYLGLEGPSFDTVLCCTNKFTMKRRFQEAGLATAPYRLVGHADQIRDAGEEVGWPIVVKPVLGAGADATRVITSPADLDTAPVQDFLRDLGAPRTTSEKTFPVLVERFLPVLDEYHCDGYVCDGKIEFVRVARYLRPVLNYGDGVFGSYLLPSDDPVAIQIREMHERAVAAVGLVHGVTHFEALNTADGLVAGEIAGRPGGGGIRRMLQLQTGFDIWDAHIASSLGESYAPAAEPASTEQFIQLMLPARRGRVRSISTADELCDLPSVVEVRMKLAPGDVVDGLMDSSTVSGYVYGRLSAELQPEEFVRSIEKIFHLDVDQEAGA